MMYKKVKTYNEKSIDHIVSYKNTLNTLLINENNYNRKNDLYMCIMGQIFKHLDKNGLCFVTQETLSNALGVDVRTIRRMIKHWEDTKVMGHPVLKVYRERDKKTGRYKINKYFVRFVYEDRHKTVNEAHKDLQAQLLEALADYQMENISESIKEEADKAYFGTMRFNPIQLMQKSNIKNYVGNLVRFMEKYRNTMDIGFIDMNTKIIELMDKIREADGGLYNIDKFIYTHLKRLAGATQIHKIATCIQP